MSLRGRHDHALSRPEVDKVASNARRDLFPETEGPMQETIKKKNHIIKDGTVQASSRPRNKELYYGMWKM